MPVFFNLEQKDGKIGPGFKKTKNKQKTHRSFPLTVILSYDAVGVASIIYLLLCPNVQNTLYLQYAARQPYPVAKFVPQVPLSQQLKFAIKYYPKPNFIPTKI